MVHLARAEDHSAAGPELTYTDNISAHGACVISSRQWKSGEVAEVTSLNDRITLRGRVAYCAKREAGRYDVGLSFNEQEVTWNPYVQICRLAGRSIIARPRRYNPGAVRPMLELKPTIWPCMPGS